MTTTALLHKSIEFEQSKSSPLNLLNHGKDDLLFVIELFDAEKQVLQAMIDSNQYYLDNCEDMAEGLRTKIGQTVDEQRERMETLLAWRNLFWSVWENVK
jgi:hypothetical protein